MLRRMFQLTEDDLDRLKDEPIPAEIPERLKPLLDKDEMSETEFLREVRRELERGKTDDEKAEIAPHEMLILKYAVTDHLTMKDVDEFLASGQSLREADLRWGTFRKASLIKADLQGADLRGADFSGADLRGATLQNADLRGARLSGAKLIRADLSQAKFDNAELDVAILQRADLSGACFKNASLSLASLKNANLKNTDFTGANLREAKLTGAEKIADAIFTGADLRNAKVRYTGLDSVELSKIGAKGGSQEYERGWKTKVFAFPPFKTSWTEFVGPWMKSLFTKPFRWLWNILKGLTFPIRWLARFLMNHLPFRRSQRSS